MRDGEALSNEERESQMTNSVLIAASMAAATTIALVLLHAPIIPVTVGAIGAGALLYRRARRTTT